MQELPPVPVLLQELLTFAANVARILASSDVNWKARPQKEEWSLTEVLCHLRDVEQEVHQPRFRSMLNEENAFLPGVVADAWAVERGYHEQDGQTALTSFLNARRETAALLESISPWLWDRRGQHAFLGPTSMHELLNLVVQHDRAHWEQIKLLVG